MATDPKDVAGHGLMGDDAPLPRRVASHGLMGEYVAPPVYPKRTFATAARTAFATTARAAFRTAARAAFVQENA